MEVVQDTNSPYVTYVLAVWVCAGFALRNKKVTNHRARLVHIYVFLRHYAGPTGVIPVKRCKPKVMAAACGVSLNTFKTWFRKLQQAGWLRYEGNTIELLSEEALYAHLGLPYGKPGDLRFYFAGDITQLKQPYYWIYLANIEDNQRRQAYRFVQKIKENKEAMAWLQQYLMQRGHDEAIIERDPRFIAAVFSARYRELFQYQKSTEVDLLKDIRPEVNRSTRGMAKAFHTSASTISHIKRKLSEQGLAHIQKLGTVASTDHNHNQYTHVRYNKVQQVTFQAFCDDIVPIKMYGTKGDEQVIRPP